MIEPIQSDAEIVEDRADTHNFLLTPCSEATFRHFYKDKPVHRGRFGNLVEALAPYGIAADFQTDPL
ncbi:DUF1989 domain-containing protein [Sphingopyxis solisilvae]|uniref:DUF1989 domain-containing protein n=1 Tax=Sphingopyxis solisilvae TaxID=1886788 RepID=UPI002B4B683D|nr:DUF1989 domain-containing protein [Sphingopyxis solisilvae]